MTAPASGAQEPDETRPAPPRSRPRPYVWGRVPQRNTSFVGRSELLKELGTRLEAGDTHILPQALRGMGGVGKTQLALEYAWRNQGAYDLVWWIPADTPTQVQQALIELAPRLGLDTDREPSAICRSVLESLQAGAPYGHWLLIYDNATDPADLAPLLPSGGTGQVLITSRSSAWRNAGGSLLEVDVFERAESIELLRRRGPAELSEADADLIADRLGDLPLAVEQTAVWLFETMMPPEEWLNVFDERFQELLTAPSATPDYPLTVGATMNLSLERLEENDPAALRLLQVCAFLATQPIPRRLFNGARNIEAPRELEPVLADPAVRLGRVLRSIDRYALARMDHRSASFQLHKLVQETLKLPLDTERRAELRHCAHQLLANFDPGDPRSVSDWPRYAELLPHIWETEQWDCESSWCRLLVLNEITFLHVWGRIRAARTLAETTVTHWTSHLGADHPQTLQARAMHANLLNTMGEFHDAHSLTREVIDTLTREFGPGDEETLSVRKELSYQLRNLGRFHEALDVSTEVLEGHERLLGRDDPLTLQVAHIHAVGLRLLGRFAESTALDRYNFERRSEILGPEHPQTLSSEYGLATGLMEQGDFGSAIDLFEDFRSIADRLYPEGNQFRTGALLIHSVLLRRTGKISEAKELSTAVFALAQQSSREDLLAYLQAAGCHSVMLRAAGDHEEALELSSATLESLRAAYGAEHPLSADASVNHAVILRLLGRPAEARALDEAALPVHTALAEQHPSTIANRINLASDLFALGDPAAARALDAATLPLSTEAVGHHHPLTLAAERNLLQDRAALGEDVTDAQRAAVVRRYAEVFGPDHPAALSATRDVRANCDLVINLL
ncbi:FxSxx-COOH system tetratricopeptide repeat protein [Nocardiopsis coralliicola]